MNAHLGDGTVDFHRLPQVGGCVALHGTNAHARIELVFHHRKIATVRIDFVERAGDAPFVERLEPWTVVTVSVQHVRRVIGFKGDRDLFTIIGFARRGMPVVGHGKGGRSHLERPAIFFSPPVH